MQMTSNASLLPPGLNGVSVITSDFLLFGSLFIESQFDEEEKVYVEIQLTATDELGHTSTTFTITVLAGPSEAPFDFATLSLLEIVGIFTSVTAVLACIGLLVALAGTLLLRNSLRRDLNSKPIGNQAVVLNDAESEKSLKWVSTSQTN